MSENRKCTIVDVARAAGTSTATVSRILSGSDYPISAQLRKKVMQVAQDLNYKPNLIGKMLQSGVGEKEIGVVLPSIVNPFYGSLMSAVEEECVQRSYVPILCLSQNSSRLESQHIEMLGQKQVSGILLSCMHMDEALMDKLRRLEIPCVLFDQTYEEYPGLNVGFDFYQGGLLATRYLIPWTGAAVNSALKGIRRLCGKTGSGSIPNGCFCTKVPRTQARRTRSSATDTNLERCFYRANACRTQCSPSMI